MGNTCKRRRIENALPLNSSETEENVKDESQIEKTLKSENRSQVSDKQLYVETPTP